MIADATKLRDETGAVVNVTATMGKTSSMARSSVRGLAFDLRLVSSGLSTLKSEFGGLNPVFEATVGSMRILSGALSAGLGTISFMTRATYAVNQQFGSWSGLINSAGGALSTLTLGTAAFAVIAGGLIGISVGTWLGEMGTGITDMKNDIKDLNKELDAYKFRLLDLQDVQLGYREDQALLSMVIKQTEYAISQQGYATDLQSAQLAAAEEQTKRLAVTNAVLSYEIAQVGTSSGRTSNQIERYGIQIKEIETGAGEWLLNQPTAGFNPLLHLLGRAPPAQLGGEIARSGPIWAEAGEVVMQKEQIATMMQSGAGGVSVSISFPGAIISSGADLEGAIARGGRRAGDELLRALNMDRYRIKRR